MILKHFDGYIIRQGERDKRIHNLYVKSIYRGKVTYTLDYTHAKTYKNRSTAAAINEKINAGLLRG